MREANVASRRRGHEFRSYSGIQGVSKVKTGLRLWVFAQSVFAYLCMISKNDIQPFLSTGAHYNFEEITIIL